MRVSGMTLGTFGGYFRIRDRPVSSTFAYNRYTRHYVLGVVYSRVTSIDERRVYTIAELDDIPSVAHDFSFFFRKNIVSPQMDPAAETPKTSDQRNTWID